MAEGTIDPALAKILEQQNLMHLAPHFIENRINLSLARLIPASVFCKLFDVSSADGEALAAAFVDTKKERLRGHRSSAALRPRKEQDRNASSHSGHSSHSTSGSRDRERIRQRDNDHKEHKDHKDPKEHKNTKDHKKDPPKPSPRTRGIVVSDAVLESAVAPCPPLPLPEPVEELSSSTTNFIEETEDYNMAIEDPAQLVSEVNEATRRIAPSSLLRDEQWLDGLLAQALPVQAKVSEKNTELALLNRTVSPAQLGDEAMRKELKQEIVEAEAQLEQLKQKLYTLTAMRNELIARPKAATITNPLLTPGLLEEIERGTPATLTSVSDPVTIRELATAVRAWQMKTTAPQEALYQMVCGAIVCGIARQANNGLPAARSFNFSFFLSCLIRPEVPAEVQLLSRLSGQLIAWIVYYLPETFSEWLRANSKHMQTMIFLTLQPSWRAAGAADDDNFELILVPLLEHEEKKHDNAVVLAICFVLNIAVDEFIRQNDQGNARSFLRLLKANKKYDLPTLVPARFIVSAACSALHRLMKRPAGDKAAIVLRRGLATSAGVDLLRTMYQHNRSSHSMGLIVQQLIEVFKAILLSDVDVPSRPVTSKFLPHLLDFHRNCVDRLVSVFDKRQAGVGITATNIVEFTILLAQTNEGKVWKHIYESKFTSVLLRICTTFPWVDIFVAQVELYVKLIINTGHRQLIGQLQSSPGWPIFLQRSPDLGKIMRQQPRK